MMALCFEAKITRCGERRGSKRQIRNNVSTVMKGHEESDGVNAETLQAAP